MKVHLYVATLDKHILPNPVIERSCRFTHMECFAHLLPNRELNTFVACPHLISSFTRMAVSFLGFVYPLSFILLLHFFEESNDTGVGVITRFELDWFCVMGKTILSHNDISAICC